MVKTKLTAADLKTISLALHYGVAERHSYADATSGSMPEQHAKALATMRHFDELHQRLFGQKTHYTMQLEADDALPRVSIFDLAKQK